MKFENKIKFLSDISELLDDNVFHMKIHVFKDHARIEYIRDGITCEHFIKFH